VIVCPLTISWRLLRDQQENVLQIEPFQRWQAIVNGRIDRSSRVEEAHCKSPEIHWKRRKAG